MRIGALRTEFAIALSKIRQPWSPVKRNFLFHLSKVFTWRGFVDRIEGVREWASITSLTVAGSKELARDVSSICGVPKSLEK